MVKDLGSKIQQSAKQGVEKAKPVTTFVGMNSIQIADFLKEKYALQIAQLLPVTNKLKAERVISMAVLVISQNESLKECTPSSVIGSIMKAAMFGFNPLPNLGQCWFIPYINSKQDAQGQWFKEKECQFQIGEKGYLKLAQNTGLIKRLISSAVHVEDEFFETLGYGATITHVPKPNVEKTWENLYAAYCIVEIIMTDSKGKIVTDTSGTPITNTVHTVLYKNDIDRLRKMGVKTADKTKMQGGWVDSPFEMAEVKAVKKCLKDKVPLSDEAHDALFNDEKIFDITDANMATKELAPVPTAEPENMEAETIEVMEVQEVVSEKELPLSPKTYEVDKIFQDVVSGKMPITALTPAKPQIALICELILNGTIIVADVPNELLSVKEIENAIYTVEQNGIKV